MDTDIKNKQTNLNHVDQSAELEHLISMANQIADNNLQKDQTERAIAVTVKHINSFWALSMKTQIIRYLHQDGKQLNEIACEAVKQLNETYQLSF